MVWFDFLEILQHTQKITPQLRTLYIKFQPFCCCISFFQEKLQNPENRRVYNESAGRALAVAFPDVLLQLGLGKWIWIKSEVTQSVCQSLELNLKVFRSWKHLVELFSVFWGGAIPSWDRIKCEECFCGMVEHFCFQSQVKWQVQRHSCSHITSNEVSSSLPQTPPDFGSILEAF